MKRSTAVLAMAITVLVGFHSMAVAAEEPAAPASNTSAAVATPPPFDAEGAGEIMLVGSEVSGLAVGQGVTLPMRIKFKSLPEDQRPHSATAVFSPTFGTPGMLSELSPTSAR